MDTELKTNELTQTEQDAIAQIDALIAVAKLEGMRAALNALHFALRADGFPEAVPVTTIHAVLRECEAVIASLEAPAYALLEHLNSKLKDMPKMGGVVAGMRVN